MPAVVSSAFAAQNAAVIISSCSGVKDAVYFRKGTGVTSVLRGDFSSPTRAVNSDAAAVNAVHQNLISLSALINLASEGMGMPSSLPNSAPERKS